MRVTYKGDYSLKAVVALAEMPAGQVSTIQELSKKLDIPIKFLEQVLLGLKNGGFLASRRGKNGGYYLAKKATDITVADVLSFVDGPMVPIACVDSCYVGCSDVTVCPIRPVFVRVNDAINQVVKAVTIKDIIESRPKPETEYAI